MLQSSVQLLTLCDTAIDLDALEYLGRHGRANLRKSAVEILLDRMMRPANLQVLCCYGASDLTLS